MFVPGFLLASLQPREATAWFAAGSPFADVCLTLGSLQHLGFAAPYPALFAGAAPLWMQAISIFAIALAVIRTPRNPRAIRFAIITLVPVAIAVVFAAMGRSIYFPVRFESVLALPFVAWIALAVEGWNDGMRRALIAVALLLGFITCAKMIETHARRGPDPYRSAALWMRERVDPRSTILASSYAFLEVESQVDDAWRASIIPFPPAQALHPGWRARIERQRLEKELALVRVKRGGAFIWVGEERSEEANVIARKARARVLYRSGGVVILAVNS